jgi:hypothetical protein
MFAIPPPNRHFGGASNPLGSDANRCTAVDLFMNERESRRLAAVEIAAVETSSSVLSIQRKHHWKCQREPGR